MEQNHPGIFYFTPILLALLTMKKILLFGAGKSATVLIAHLTQYCEKNNCRFFVCDQNLEATQKKISGFQNSSAVSVDVTNETSRRKLVSEADIVISLLPPSLHILVAKDCVFFSRNLLTASYVDEAMQSLAAEVESRNILFLAEMGLDPGIDHMSAMRVINALRAKNAKIHSFLSHCGGLVAPESDDNPWHYKVTWNPANVVMAGSSGAHYLSGNKEIQIGYPAVFANDAQQIDVNGLGKLSWYANRDSLTYMETYGLDGLSDFIRTTLRYPEYIRAWNLIVHLGLTKTDDGADISQCNTYREWYSSKLNSFSEKNIDEKTALLLKDQNVQHQFDFLGFFSDDTLPAKDSSAKILQSLLENKLVMKPTDKDMIVMVHEVEYILGNEFEKLVSTLIVKGTDSRHTAMAKTVGMPLAIAAILILEGKISLKGLHIPVLPEIYEPVLAGLEENGILFEEIVERKF